MTPLSLLLVEDNPDHADLFELTLAETMYRAANLSVTGSLREGLERLEAGGIDLVFLDLSLPDSDLSTTIERLSEVAKSHPVVVMTSLDHGPKMLELISRGAEDCLPKIEMHPPVLERVIRFALDRFEQRTFSRAVLQAVPEPMVYISPDVRVLGCNQAFETLVGSTAARMQGRLVDDVCPAPLANELGLRTGDIEATEQHATELELVDAGGATREGILHQRRFTIGSGRTGGTVATFVDLTESRRMQRKLREQEERRFESLTALAGGIAHDFNNSLMVILGHSELGKDDTEPGSSMYEALDAISSAATSSAERVRQLLAFSGHVAGRRHVVELSPLVEEAVTRIRSSTDPRISLRHIVTSHAVAFADPRHVDLIVRSLVLNAIEAIEGDVGEVEVETSTHEADGVTFGQLTVRDDGRGMDAATLSRAVDPFFSTKMTGRGLGLAAAYGVVQRYRGLWDIDSAPDRGTTCTVRLPSGA